MGVCLHPRARYVTLGMSGGNSTRIVQGTKEGVTMTTQWNHRTAVVNGLNIHYVTYGQGSPVILLHDWPEFWYSYRQSDKVSWACILPSYRPERPVIPGHLWVSRTLEILPVD
jgi:hypothetical protein